MGSDYLLVTQTGRESAVKLHFFVIFIVFNVLAPVVKKNCWLWDS